MDSSFEFLLSIGVILLLGQAVSTLGRKTFLPRVTLLLLFGILIGEEGLDIIPQFFIGEFELISQMTLLMVGFLIGGKLTGSALRNGLNRALWISASTALGTALIVCACLILFGLPLGLSIILGCIASATAPAATLDVVMETGAKSEFSELLISVVAMDDIWALMLFGAGVALVATFGAHVNDTSPILLALHDIGGAILLGLVLGFPAAYLTGRIKPGEPILSEAMGLVFVCGGLSLCLEVSFLITAIVMGMIVANFAKHHDYTFHEIENIEWPFMVIFFVLAGATLEFEFIESASLIALVYILSRIVGKIAGARFGAQLSKAEPEVKKWMGMALLPQAGVAIGMALVASTHFPEYRQVLMSLVISTTIFFEILGPIFTRLAIQNAR